MNFHSDKWIKEKKMKWYDEYALNSIFLYYSLFNYYISKRRKKNAR